MHALARLGICSSIVCIFALTASAQSLRDGIDRLAEQIVKGAPDDRKIRIAVADFPDLLNITSNLGRYVANKLTTSLSQSQKFLVVERQRLEQVLTELKFGMSDIVNPEKAKQLGQVVGVEAIVVGTVSDLGSQVDLDARMIEIDTSHMLVSASATISKDQVVSQLMERGREEGSASVMRSVTSPTSFQGERQYKNPVADSFYQSLKTAAAALSERAEKSVPYDQTAQGLIDEYNNLIAEIKPILQQEPFIQALQPLKFHGDRQQAAGSVVTAAKGLAAYLENFSAQIALQASATSLADYASKSPPYDNTVKGWLAEYNRLIHEAKAAFKDNKLVQSLQELKFSGDRGQSAAAVANSAKKLQVFMSPTGK